MPTSKAGRSNSRAPQPGDGFSLIELLVVLCIFGLGLFTLMPALTSREDRLGSQEEFLEQVRREAMHTGRIQRVCFRYGKAELAWGNSTWPLESAVAAATLETKRVPGAGGCFSYYPSGMADSFSLRLASGQIYRTAVLTGRLQATSADRELEGRGAAPQEGDARQEFAP